MSASPTTFDSLVAAARGGDERAARDLVDAYGHHIVRVVRRLLPDRLRSQYDSLDFEQAVWLSFLAPGEGTARFAASRELEAYLKEIARHKVADAVTRHFARKRDLNLERAIEQAGGLNAVGPARGETPSQAAIADERWATMTEGRDDRGRLLLEMLRDQHSHEEAAERTGLSLKAIQRFVRKLRQEAA